MQLKSFVGGRVKDLLSGYTTGMDLRLNLDEHNQLYRVVIHLEDGKPLADFIDELAEGSDFINLLRIKEDDVQMQMKYALISRHSDHYEIESSIEHVTFKTYKD
jgi:hypothetical protein